ncbi:MAG: acetolactate synthase, large subunit, biosynthetic type [Clostridiaceae bacterium]|nr:acetolactate synthase, large subunit, biosynthetic type [Clostridiaceae bacterium]
MKMTGAEAIIRVLEAENVDTIFGYPGAAISPFYDALLDSSIKHILTRTEQGAAHAANGYARVTGRTGVCVATSGPGATNLITGIANSYMDSVPMVAITGQVRSDMIGTDAFQEADITGATAPFSKHNYLVKRAGDLPRIIKEAFHIASTGRPGPVVIDIPVDVQNTVIDFHYPEHIDIKGYKPTIKGHPGQVRKAAAALQAAKKPVICAGGGLITADASGVMLELAEKRNIPVVTTLMGIGSIPSDHPLHFGMVGTHGSPTANYVLHHADLVIILGARVGDRAMGAAGALAKKAKIIHIDIDPAEIGKNIYVTVPLVGDLKHILGAMLELVEAGRNTEWLGGIADWKRKNSKPASWEANGQYAGNGSQKSYIRDKSDVSDVSDTSDVSDASDVADIPETEYVNPKYLLSILSDYLPEDAIITTEVGQNQIWAANHFKVRKPRTFITSGGLGTMGYGLPSATGAKVGRPDSTVVVISGDGSFQMSMQELGTMKQYGIDVKIVLFNNHRLGMVRELQLTRHGGRYSQVFLDSNPDFVALAAAYGFRSERITSNARVREALERMTASSGPYVLECLVDPMEPTL